MNQHSAIVIGAGIVALATARSLAVRGYKVKVFERNENQAGASVRNFGMIWPVGQPAGELFDRAMLSRSIWKEICEHTGMWYNESGSLHLAYHDDEMAVMTEYADEGKSYRNCRMLTVREALKYSPVVKAQGLKGALWSETEMIVDARKAISRVAAFLAEQYGVEFLYNTAISRITYPKVYSGNRSWEADEIFVCSGADFETLYPEVFRAAGITKCKLQMMRLAAKDKPVSLGPSLCGGLSLAHYTSFKVAPSLQALRTRFEKEMPDFINWGIHVMVTQNGDGELVVGDSHEYGLAPDPFDKTFINRMILDYLQQFSVFTDHELSASWNGVYAKMTNGQTEFIYQPENGVSIINGLGGAGMTLSFGLAEQYFSRRQNNDNIENKVSNIFSLYDKYGNEEYGEGVTQLMHMVQAGNLALKEGYDEEMVLAAFFHDIGHFLENGKDMKGYGKHDHDRLGYHFLLQHGFSERVAALVASHVPAKRYLTYKDSDYLANLSEASRITLGFQGGPMTIEEAAAFEADPLINEYIKIRLWDDQAKETDIPVDPADVEVFKKLTISYLKRQQNN